MHSSDNYDDATDGESILRMPTAMINGIQRGALTPRPTKSPLVLFRKDRIPHRRKPLAGVSGGGLFRFGSEEAAWFKGREGPVQLKVLTLGTTKVH